MNKSVKDNVLKWIISVAGKKKLYIILLMCFNVLQGVCSIGTAVVLKRVVDEAIVKDHNGFMYFVCLLIGIICIQVGLSIANNLLSEYVCATFENQFKGRLFSELLKKDYGMVTAKHSGEWINRLTSDTVVVADGLTRILPGLAGMLIRLIGALMLIIVFLPKIAYIIVPGGIVLLIVTYGIRKVMKRMHKLVQESDGRLRVFVQETLVSMMVVRAFAKERESIDGAALKMEEHKSARMKKSIFSGVCSAGFAAVMNGIYVLCVAYCGLGIISGSISYGTLMAVMQLVGQVQSPLANITGVLPKYYAMIASAERLMEIESYKEDFQEIKDLREINSFYADEFESIGIKDGAFSYVSDHEEKILENININVNKGEFVALTGPSGCGKSTLLKLLMCLYPLDEGEKYIASTSESKAYDSYYKRLFAYVPQGNHLMSGTIGEVVAFFDKERVKDSAKIEEALKIACAYDFVKELKDGIDTVLGERGCGLSEGQMQRISIARAIFSGCPILMLDEATSALDEHTEKEVLENLRRMTDKTVMIVTHRPAALEICDRKVEM